MTKQLVETVIPIKGAEVVDERRIGSLGRVFIVKRPANVGAEAWGGFELLLMRRLAPQDGESQEAIDTFISDAAELIGIEHPSLLQVYGMFKREDEKYLVIECPAGEDLASMGARGMVDYYRTQTVAKECADALAKMARMGIAHRDFTSSCVYITDKSVKVVPLAVQQEFRVETAISPGGIYHGRSGYAAPELHADGGKNPTERSNIFAFGVMLYECLAKQPPFRGGTPSRVLESIQKTPLTPLSKIKSDIPSKLENVTNRCLNLNPELRYENFAMLEASLRPGGNTSQLRSKLDKHGNVVPVKAKGARGGSKALGIIVILLLALAAGIAGIIITADDTQDVGLEEATPEVVLKRIKEMIDSGQPYHAYNILSKSKADSFKNQRQYKELYRIAIESGLRHKAKKLERDGKFSDALFMLMKLNRYYLGELEIKPSSKQKATAEFKARLANLRLAIVEQDAKKSFEQKNWLEAHSSYKKACQMASEQKCKRTRIEMLTRRKEFVARFLSAKKAREAGNRHGEIVALIEADGVMENEDVALRLKELGLNCEKMKSCFSEAQKLFSQEQYKEAHKKLKMAKELWPTSTEVVQALRYFDDKKMVTDAGMALITIHNPFEGWGKKERAKAFAIDIFEYPNKHGALPMTRVSWIKAKELAGERGGRLPTIAEWRLAAGGKEKYSYTYGNEYKNSVANNLRLGLEKSGKFSQDVSAFGVYDMGGNLSEWTSTHKNNGRIVAGGHWASAPDETKTNSIFVFSPTFTNSYVGFRVVKSLTAFDTKPQDGE